VGSRGIVFNEKNCRTTVGCLRQTPLAIVSRGNDTNMPPLDRTRTAAPLRPREELLRPEFVRRVLLPLVSLPGVVEDRGQSCREGRRRGVRPQRDRFGPDLWQFSRQAAMSLGPASRLLPRHVGFVKRAHGSPLCRCLLSSVFVSCNKVSPAGARPLLHNPRTGLAFLGEGGRRRGTSLVPPRSTT
jgi:hypothetical protein